MVLLFWQTQVQTTDLMCGRFNIWLIFNISAFVVVFVLMTMNNSDGREKLMVENEHNIRDLVDEFIKNDDIDALENAIDEIEAIEEPDKLQEQDFESYRSAKLIHLLDVFNAIDSKKIPDFNFDDMPELAVSPPPETGLPSGVSPDSVKDPAMKAKFEEDIQKNQTKKNVYDFQFRLNKLDEYSTGNYKEHISMKYSRKVGDLAEIEALVEKNIVSNHRKALLNEILMNPDPID